MRNAPHLPEYLQPYWEAFEELSTCRSYIGMTGSPGPIPWTAICRYADKHGFAGDSFDDLVAIVRATDDAFRAHVQEKSPKPDEPRPVQQKDGSDRL